MKVAINTSPLQTEHKVRGVGSYTQRLQEALKKGNYNINFEFFQDPASPPPANVIHYPYFDLFFHTLPTKRKKSRVVTIHDVIPLIFPSYFPSGIKGYINFYFQKRALKNTDYVICDSQTSKKDIMDKLSYPEEKIKVIYLAAGENFKPEKSGNKLEEIKRKYKLPKDFVLFVGDVNWNKNLKNLINAVKIAKVNLVMIGSALRNSNLYETQQINKLIRKLKLENKIIKTGFVPEEDLICIYNLASLTLLPSFYEGFGLPVLESMACGTPVVCASVASLAEIGNEMATFCDPQDPKDIAQKIESTLALSQNQRAILAIKLITYASKFTWKKVADQTVKVYESLL